AVQSENQKFWIQLFQKKKRLSEGWWCGHFACDPGSSMDSAKPVPMAAMILRCPNVGLGLQVPATIQLSQEFAPAMG
ncbi:MAG: hypothetical protein ACNA8L_13855, partial [Luteolibacter sp.]